MKRTTIIAAVLAVAASLNAAPAPAPWIVTAASYPTPALAGDVPAYVVLDETVMTVGTDGTVTERRRSALRVLTQKGDDLALATLPYTEKVDKLASGGAWLVRAGKTVKHEPLNRWVDICMVADGTVFTERRNRMISFPRETLKDDVFAYETVAVRPMLLPQLNFDFTMGVPIGVERVEVILPKGWTLNYVVQGADVPAPTVDAARNSWAWESRNRAHLPAEEWTPRVTDETPRLFFTLGIPANTKGVNLPRIESWGDVGAWVDQLGEGQCDTSPALADTTKRLAAPAGDRSSLLRALTGHVQHLRYVSVESGLGLGFGYKPRKASEVLARGYGDCKDKANLLRAMLRELGITAYMVAVESGRRHPTAGDWPSVQQFNHVISAIEVDPSVDFPSVIQAPDGKRLLLFDPTDEFTVLGDLPWYLQGATGLLVRGADSCLVQIPELPGDTEWNYETEAQLAVAADGAASGRVEFIARRQAGRGARAAMRNLTPKEISDNAARYMSTMLRGVVVRDARFLDDTVSGDTMFGFELNAPGVLQPGPGGIFMMRLDVFNRDSVPQLGPRDRVQPVEIRPIVHVETVTFELPDGIAVDDAPKDTREESAYGLYERTVAVAGRKVVLRRSLRFIPQLVPASDYTKIRAFLTAAARADKAAVVLKRAP